MNTDRLWCWGNTSQHQSWERVMWGEEQSLTDNKPEMTNRERNVYSRTVRGGGWRSRDSQLTVSCRREFSLLKLTWSVGGHWWCSQAHIGNWAEPARSTVSQSVLAALLPVRALSLTCHYRLTPNTLVGADQEFHQNANYSICNAGNLPQHLLHRFIQSHFRCRFSLLIDVNIKRFIF